MTYLLSLAPAVIQSAALVGLYFVYRKKEQEEAGFATKLLGYFLLGCFSFRIDSVPVPLGFAAHLLFFRPTVHGSLKRRAACIGFIAFLTGLLCRSLNET